MTEPDALADWTSALTRALDLDVVVDVELILDLARQAAHAVSRPAAPVTTFLVGYAAALRGGGPEAVAAAAATAERLAGGWPPS